MPEVGVQVRIEVVSSDVWLAVWWSQDDVGPLIRLTHSHTEPANECQLKNDQNTVCATSTAHSFASTCHCATQSRAQQVAKSWAKLNSNWRRRRRRRSSAAKTMHKECDEPSKRSRRKHEEFELSTRVVLSLIFQ